MLEINTVKSIEINSKSLKINNESILELLGYEKNQNDQYLNETIRTCIFKCIPLFVPKGAYIIQKINVENREAGKVKIKSIELNVNKIISSQLKDSDQIVFFIATIGKNVEEYSDSLFKNGDLLEGYIVNLIASEAAESVAETIHKLINEQMKEIGLNCTNRFSPGYCNWNVEEQFKLFQHFPENCCGITLTDSALMNPVKSVSGIIGLGKNAIKKEYPCKVCDEDNCLYKKKESVVSFDQKL